MIFAYADPPYLGCAKKFYGDPTYDAVEAHRDLLLRLDGEYPDGWAYSLTSASLQAILPFAPEGHRVAAWVKPFHIFKKGVRPAYAWEPVIFKGGRNANHAPPPKGGQATTPRDWVSANVTLRKGLAGAKPEAFCYWLFDLLNIQEGDELHDLFPGTKAVTMALDAWRRQRPLQLAPATEGASPTPPNTTPGGAARRESDGEER